MKGLLKIPLDSPGDPPAPGKVSEMILDFAEPLLSLGADGPPDITALRSALVMAEMCWNLPVFEKANNAAYGQFKRGFDDVLQASPGPMADLLRQLIHDRKTRFAGVPFLVTVRVEGAGSDAKVVAEARMPGTGQAATRKNSAS